MWNRFSNWLARTWLGRFRNWLNGFTKRIFKPIAIIIILILVWYGFLMLVAPPPLDTTPVLIMVWATAVLLLLALFPSILEKVKKIKVGDIEVELKDTVASSIIQDIISITDLSFAYDTAAKGREGDLQLVLGQAYQAPEKPILLIVNLKGDISISFLFTYLLLMDLISQTIVVVFISENRYANKLTEIKPSNVLGMISGKKLLQYYYQRFPSLIKIFTVGNDVQNLYSSQFNRIPSQELISTLREKARIQIIHDMSGVVANRRDFGGDLLGMLEDEFSDKFSNEDLLYWLSNVLTKRIIDFSLQAADVETIRLSLTQSDDFILIKEGKFLHSIVVLDRFSKNISQKVLSQLVKK